MGGGGEGGVLFWYLEPCLQRLDIFVSLLNLIITDISLYFSIIWKTN